MHLTVTKCTTSGLAPQQVCVFVCVCDENKPVQAAVSLEMKIRSFGLVGKLEWERQRRGRLRLDKKMVKTDKKEKKQ